MADGWDARLPGGESVSRRYDQTGHLRSALLVVTIVSALSAASPASSGRGITHRIGSSTA
jgi:hypothetical protein